MKNQDHQLTNSFIVLLNKVIPSTTLKISWVYILLISCLQAFQDVFVNNEAYFIYDVLNVGIWTFLFVYQVVKSDEQISEAIKKEKKHIIWFLIIAILLLVGGFLATIRLTYLIKYLFIPFRFEPRAFWLQKLWPFPYRLSALWKIILMALVLFSDILGGIAILSILFLLYVWWTTRE